MDFFITITVYIKAMREVGKRKEKKIFIFGHLQ